MPASTPVFSIREALRFGWQRTLDHLNPLIVLGLIAGALSAIANAASGVRGGFVLTLAVQLAQTFVGFVFLRALLRIAGGQRVVLSRSEGWSDGFASYFVTTFLLGLLVALGFVLLIVPGVLWGLRYGFAPFLVADKRLEPMAAFHESRRLTEGLRGELLGFVAVLILVNLLGALALGVGLLFSVPTTGLAAVFVYQKLLARAEHVEPPHAEHGVTSWAT
jgi:uncharacterized membrane protein